MSDPNTDWATWDATDLVLANDTTKTVLEALDELIGYAASAVHAGNADAQGASDAAELCKHHARNPELPQCNTEDVHKQCVINAWNAAMNGGEDGADWARIKDELEHTPWATTILDLGGGKSHPVSVALEGISALAQSMMAAAMQQNPTNPAAYEPMLRSSEAASACLGHSLNPELSTCNSVEAHKTYVVDAWLGSVGAEPGEVDWARIKMSLDHTGTGGDTPRAFSD